MIGNETLNLEKSKQKSCFKDQTTYVICKLILSKRMFKCKIKNDLKELIANNIFKNYHRKTFLKFTKKKRKKRKIQSEIKCFLQKYNI